LFLPLIGLGIGALIGIIAGVAAAVVTVVVLTLKVSAGLSNTYGMGSVNTLSSWGAPYEATYTAKAGPSVWEKLVVGASVAGAGAVATQARKRRPKLKKKEEKKKEPYPQESGEEYETKVNNKVKTLLTIISATVGPIVGGKELIKTIRENNQSGFDDKLVICHGAIESGLTNGQMGALGELGVFQLKLSTANSVGLGAFTADAVRFDPALNTRLATTHLRSLYNRFGNLRTALGAYKQGAARTAERGLSPASQLYADAVQRCAQQATVP
jgi:O-acetyl-ADP-ribose deacetylase (regulator of RNase III)